MAKTLPSSLSQSPLCFGYRETPLLCSIIFDHSQSPRTLPSSLSQSQSPSCFRRKSPSCPIIFESTTIATTVPSHCNHRVPSRHLRLAQGRPRQRATQPVNTNLVLLHQTLDEREWTTEALSSLLLEVQRIFIRFFF